MEECTVFSLLLSFQFRTRKAYPGEELLARSLGVSKSTVKRHIVSLEKKGFLRRDFRTGRTTEYNTNPAIEKLHVHNSQYHAQKRADTPSKNGQTPYSELNPKEYPPKRKVNKSTEALGDLVGSKYRMLLRNRHE